MDVDLPQQPVPDRCMTGVMDNQSNSSQVNNLVLASGPLAGSYLFSGRAAALLGSKQDEDMKWKDTMAPKKRLVFRKFFWTPNLEINLALFQLCTKLRKFYEEEKEESEEEEEKLFEEVK